MLYFSQLQILRPPMFLYVSVTNSTYLYKDKLLQPKISRHQYLGTYHLQDKQLYSPQTANASILPIFQHCNMLSSSIEPIPDPLVSSIRIFLMTQVSHKMCQS